MTLDVLICTCGRDGIERVAQMKLPQTDGVAYVVSWQLTDDEFDADVPQALARHDLKVYKMNGRGLSRNRNNAISHSTADICLIADDDLDYTDDQLAAVMTTFEQNEHLDVAAFRFSGSGKVYPAHEFDLAQMPKGYYVSSVEIAFRRQSVGELRFNEWFGLGAPVLHSGEESVFVYQALCHGLKCRYFPITITHHGATTTGVRTLTPGVLMAQGAYLSIVHRATALMRIFLFAWRSWRLGRVKLFPAVRHLVKGYIFGKRYFNTDGSIKCQPPR